MKTGRQRGFTLIEAVVVLALLGVMAAIAWGSVRDLLPRFRMMSAAKQLKADLAELRNTAIVHNRETRLLLVSADSSYTDPGSPSAGAWWLQVGNRSLNARNWELMPADAAEDGTDDDTSQGVIDIAPGGNRAQPGASLIPWDPIAGPGTGNGDAIVFSPRGWVTNPAGDFSSDGYISLTLVNKVALAHGVDDSVTLLVARSGMVRMETSMGGGS